MYYTDILVAFDIQLTHVLIANFVLLSIAANTFSACQRVERESSALDPPGEERATEPFEMTVTRLS